MSAPTGAMAAAWKEGAKANLAASEGADAAPPPPAASAGGSGGGSGGSNSKKGKKKKKGGAPGGGGGGGGGGSGGGGAEGELTTEEGGDAVCQLDGTPFSMYYGQLQHQQNMLQDSVRGGRIGRTRGREGGNK